MDHRSFVLPSVPPVEGPSTRVPGYDGPRLVVVVLEASFASVDQFGGDVAFPRIGLDRKLDDFTAGGSTITSPASRVRWLMATILDARFACR
jgi:hypothetical protein